MGDCSSLLLHARKMTNSTTKIGILLCLFLFIGTRAFAEDVVVDFSRPIGPATCRACGFLHGISAGSPDDSLLSPLKIRYVRGTPHDAGSMPGLLDIELQKRLASPGLRLALGVYYYDKNKVAGHKEYYPGDDGDWASWDSIVENIVKEALSKKITCNWVIWNEPDFNWRRGLDRYRQAWKRAYEKIRSLDTAAVITGPTRSHYSFNELTSFLKFCKGNACIPDMVTWHENTNAENHIKAHVEDIRRWCNDNDVSIKGIIIDEYGNKTSQYLPGVAVGFISAFEEAKVTFASRSVWTKSKNLCGLTTDDGKKPLSVWWVYKAYSEIAGTLYAVEETENCRALAGADLDASSAQMLIGNQSKDAQPVHVTLENLPKSWGGQNFTVRRLLIPETGEKAMEAPQSQPETSSEVTNDVMKIDVGMLPGYGAVEVTVSPSRRLR
jgi:hypothetical protein